MRFDLTSMIGGVLLGALFTVSIARPAVGRRIGRVASVVLLGLGCAFGVWIGAAELRGEPIRAPGGGDWISHASEGFAWAAGFLAAGLIGFALTRAPRSRIGDDGDADPYGERLD